MPGSPPATSGHRLLTLDALRGLAVFLMIEQHLGVWLWRGPDPGRVVADYPFLIGFNALGGGAAPLFVTLAGAGCALFVATGRERTDRTLFARGLVLMGFGYLLNFMTPSWFSWGSWFVLHMMGFAMMLAPIWRRLPTWVLLALAGAVLLASGVVQEWLHTPRSLSNPRMRDVTLPGGMFRLALAEGQFPILPWLAFFLAGFASGRFVHARRVAPVVATACLFAVCGVGLIALEKLAIITPASPIAYQMAKIRLGFYPAPAAMACLLMTIPLVCIAVSLRIERHRSLSSNNPLVTLGRGSLTLLMLHVVMFREWTRPIDVWRGLSASTALVVIFSFVGIALVLTRWWQRAGYRYGAEWALRKLAQPLS